MVKDTHRYTTNEPESDMHGLGVNPALPVLDRKRVRQQLTFLDPACLKDRERAVRILMERITDYYQCIGYVGPKITSYQAELGYSLGGWIVEHRMPPWRESYVSGQPVLRDNPQKVFLNVRYASFDIALMLAAWELNSSIANSAR